MLTRGRSRSSPPSPCCAAAAISPRRSHGRLLPEFMVAVEILLTVLVAGGFARARADPHGAEGDRGPPGAVVGLPPRSPGPRAVRRSRSRRCPRGWRRSSSRPRRSSGWRSGSRGRAAAVVRRRRRARRVRGRRGRHGGRERAASRRCSRCWRFGGVRDRSPRDPHLVRRHRSRPSRSPRASGVLPLAVPLGWSACRTPRRAAGPSRPRPDRRREHRARPGGVVRAGQERRRRDRAAGHLPEPAGGDAAGRGVAGERCRRGSARARGSLRGHRHDLRRRQLPRFTWTTSTSES